MKTIHNQGKFCPRQYSGSSSSFEEAYAMAEAVYALKGVRIVDLTERVAGPYCTYLLAGLGADVIKVEPPEGELGRRAAPFAFDQVDPELSLPFLHLNRGKRSIVIDPSAPDAADSLVRLCHTADALVLDANPAKSLARWGLNSGDVRESSSTLIICSLPPFASGTPWADWSATEIILEAVSGCASCTGEFGRPPLKMGGNLAQIAHGQTAAVALLCSLLAVKRGGRGVDIEVPGAEANAEMLGMWTGGSHQRMARVGREHQTNYPWKCYRASDGWVGVHSGPGSWINFCNLIGAPNLAQFENLGARLEARQLIDGAIEHWLSSTTKVEAYHAGQAARFGFGYVATVEDLVNSPQLDSRHFFRTISHPAAGEAKYPGPPFTPRSGWRDARAPLLGEHTEEVLAELSPALDSKPRNGPDRPDSNALEPLRGIRVLDLTQIWAGPRAAMILSDWGADVIKIESRDRIGGLRGQGDALNERSLNRRSGYENLHRGKRHITLDLTTGQGAKAFRQLVEVSDVVIANFAAGVLSKLGASFDELRQVNPGIVVVSMTGFGDSGPERDYVAYGVAQEQLCGIYSSTGYEDEEPLKSGFNVGDPMNGTHGALAVLAALVERQRTGLGQYVDLSQFESSVPLIGELLLDYSVNRRVARPAGNTDPTWAPHGIYPTAGNDGWVALVARDQEEWLKVLATLDANYLSTDRRFRDLGDRVLNHQQLDEELARLTSNRERDELAAALQRVGVPAAPILHTDEVWAHPYFHTTGFLQHVHSPDDATYTYLGPMWRVNGDRPVVRSPAPLTGEHNEEVLRTLTRLNDEEISGLVHRAHQDSTRSTAST